MEPHSALSYYLNNPNNSYDAVDATAALVGHVLDTGCSDAYDILRNKFDTESLEYIQDFLTGKSCDKYKAANVVCIERHDEFSLYMIKVSNRGKFELNVSFDKNKNPEQFSLKEYAKRDKVEQAVEK